MNETEFAYWLKGFFELSETNHLTEKQVMIIKDHLNLVFNKVTPDRKSSSTDWVLQKALEQAKQELGDLPVEQVKKEKYNPIDSTLNGREASILALLAQAQTKKIPDSIKKEMLDSLQGKALSVAKVLVGEDISPSASVKQAAEAFKSWAEELPVIDLEQTKEEKRSPLDEVFEKTREQTKKDLGILPKKSKKREYYWEKPKVISSNMTQEEIDAYLILEKFTADDPDVTEKDCKKALKTLDEKARMKYLFGTLSDEDYEKIKIPKKKEINQKNTTNFPRPPCGGGQRMC